MHPAKTEVRFREWRGDPPVRDARAAARALAQRGGSAGQLCRAGRGFRRRPAFNQIPSCRPAALSSLGQPAAGLRGFHAVGPGAASANARERAGGLASPRLRARRSCTASTSWRRTRRASCWWTCTPRTSASSMEKLKTTWSGRRAAPEPAGAGGVPGRAPRHRDRRGEPRGRSSAWASRSSVAGPNDAGGARRAGAAGGRRRGGAGARRAAGDPRVRRERGRSPARQNELLARDGLPRGGARQPRAQPGRK